MSKDFKKGDKVTWNTPQGETEGKVVKTVTDDVKVGGTQLRASKDDPRVIVESDKSGKQAGHKPDSVKRLESVALTDQQEEVRADFGELVNMTRRELEGWLETDESKAVGQSDDGGESTGHASGRRIVELLDTKKAELTDDDVAHMRKVTGYIKRHLAQEPSKQDVEASRWRYSLMNWGHDPLES